MQILPLTKANKYLIVILLFFTATIAIVFIKRSSRGHSESKALSNISWVPVTLPYKFKNDKAKQLRNTASDLKKDGHYGQAIKLYQDAIKIENDNPQLYFELAECYGRNDDLLQAVTIINKAIALDSSYAGFYNNRGMYYYHLFEDDNATADLEKAVSLDNKNPTYYLNLSLVYYSTNKFDEACNSFQAAKVFGLDTNSVRTQKEFVKLQEFCKTNYGVNL